MTTVTKTGTIGNVRDPSYINIRVVWDSGTVSDYKLEPPAGKACLRMAKYSTIKAASYAKEHNVSKLKKRPSRQLSLNLENRRSNMSKAKKLIEQSIIEVKLPRDIEKAASRSGLNVDVRASRVHGDEVTMYLELGDDVMSVTLYPGTREFTCDDLEDRGLSREASSSLQRFVSELERSGWYLV